MRTAVVLGTSLFPPFSSPRPWYRVASCQHLKTEGGEQDLIKRLGKCNLLSVIGLGVVLCLVQQPATENYQYCRQRNSMLKRGGERRQFHTSKKNKRNVDSLPCNKAKYIECSQQRNYLHEIFLGGSCKPTTWRTDIAIPHLEKNKISFYNPQVQNWVPELIKQENIAKEKAEVMFFVIDKQTRSVASIIEVAYIAGTQRKLITVIYELTGLLQVMGERISEREFKELQNGRHCLQKVLKYHKKNVFDDIKPALTDAVRTVQSIRFERSSPISKKRKTLFGHHNKSNFPVKAENEKRFSWSRKSRPFRGRNIFPTIPMLDVFQKKIRNRDSNLQSKNFLNHSNSKCCFDVCLVGSEKTSSWKEDVALPIFRKNELKSLCCTINDWTEDVKTKISDMKSCRVVLFVITDSERGMVEMTLAAHCIGMKENVVLCIQHLKNDTEIDGDKLSFQAVKDYNRGRVYLSDLANQNNVPVFKDLNEAVQCVVEKCVTPMPIRTSLE